MFLLLLTLYLSTVCTWNSSLFAWTPWTLNISFSVLTKVQLDSSFRNLAWVDAHTHVRKNTSIAALRACNNHCFLIINTRIFRILGFRDLCTCVFSRKIMMQVITSSDLHFIFFLKITQRILMVVLHAIAVVFIIFMGFIVSLPSVCVYHSLSANINPSNTTLGVSKVCLM
jgi:hypothetical protein